MAGDIGFSLAQLQYFIAAAETGNISTAAQRLHVSQSAMSSAIIQLERHLGCDLFLRKHARGITLTANGQRLLGESRALLRQAQDLEQTSYTLQHGVRGEVAVGCFVTLAPFYLPSVLRALRQRHPALTVRVHEGDGELLAQLLRSGRIETALMYGLDMPGDLEFHRVAEHRPYALVDDGHPLAHREAVTLSELATGPMVLLDLPQTRQFIMHMLTVAGVRPPSIVPTTSFETMRGLVAAGEGFTLLNQRVATAHTYDGSRVNPVELRDDVDSVQVGAVSMRGVRSSRRAQSFVEACRTHARCAAVATAPDG